MNVPARMKGKTRGKSGTTQEPSEVEEPSVQIKSQKSLSPLFPLPRRILAPTDFSECSLQAVEYAVELAKALGARLILLHIAEPLHAEGLLQVSPAAEDMNQNLLDKSRERLAAIGRSRAVHCPPEQILVRLGHAYSEITDTANALGADLIVLGAHGIPPLKPEFLGSTAERVIRKAGCPVVIVREQASERH